MNRLSLILFLCAVAVVAKSQADNQNVSALRITQPIEIDGQLSEGEWKEAPVATGFTQLRQVAGAKPAKPTFVKVLYDDDALYIGAFMQEVSADSVLRQLSSRDQSQNTDRFGIVLDTYRSGLNGFGFFVTAAGVQIDEQYSEYETNRDWNAVWDSEVSISDDGWRVEMRIPYSAIRFSEEENYVWNVNFMRIIRRIRQENWWNPIDPNVDGLLTQSGTLSGIKDIEPPLRLMLYPYVSTFTEHFKHYEPGVQDLNNNFNGGLDVKYGINDAFTLDMTLVPDFNQALSDRQVLNLSPFEVFFNENRQFFTEGTELFNKGGWFYSRRVGGRPLLLGEAYDALGENENLINAASQSQLVNATKVSGRNSKGLGIGVFNGITAEEKAIARNIETGDEREVLIDPLTNYNVMVFDKLLKNNSYVTLVNTNVLRAGSTYDANLTGVDLKIADKNNNYALRGNGAFNQKLFSDSTSTGYTYYLSADKISGVWTYGVEHGVESDTYDPNDLGFLFNNNSIYTNVYGTYQRNDPWWFLNRHRVNVYTTYERLYQPNKFANLGIYLNTFFFTKKILGFGLNAGLEPIQTFDFFEPRETGRFYAYPTNYNVGGFVSTDYSKVFAIDVNLNYRNWDEPGRSTVTYRVEPRVRVSDKLSFVYSHSIGDNKNDIGWVNAVNDSIIFGRRNRLVHNQTLSGSYIFTDRMGMTARIRHIWDRVDYNRYFLLGEEGELDYTDYSGLDEEGISNHQVNFSAFNVDLVFSWFFKRGSELSIGYKNQIGNSKVPLDRNLFEAWNTTFRTNQVNSLSIKLLYFIDYQALKKSSK